MHRFPRTCVAKIMSTDGSQTDRRTDGWTDRQTDVQTEWFLYTPLNFVHGWYNNNHFNKLLEKVWLQENDNKWKRNGKCRKKWMRNGDMTISFLPRDALYNQDYNTCTSEALFTWVSPGMCRLLNGSELSETSQCSLVSTNK